MNVCRTCGVMVLQNRLGRWVHTDAVPANFDVHEAVSVSKRDYDARPDFVSLAEAASDMLLHHNSLHPATECEWAHLLREALRRDSGR